MGTKISENPTLTPIQSFYSGQTLFITGATGFLGKLVLEKLLRDCSEIKKVFLLVRAKRGTDEKKRLADLFDSQVFDLVKKQQPSFQEKISLIEGDLTKPVLGISPSDQELLKNEVTSIFHIAATVKFNETVRVATYINVRSVYDLLEMAKEMKNIRAIVHVSTAYSHCARKEIDEKVYKSNIEPKQLMDLVELLEDNILNAMTPAILGNSPNTYCFTKAVGERLVEDAQKYLPVAIVRPSIVISCYKQPCEGWSDSIYGYVGITLGVALGIIRTIRMDQKKRCDLIPADFVVNCIIAAGWEIENLRNRNNNRAIENNKVVQEVPVYNCVTSAQNPTTYGEFNRLIELQGPEYASSKCIWYYVFISFSSYFWYNVAVFLLHTVPAHIIDFILRLMRKEPMLVKGYQKIYKQLEALGHFSVCEWTWTDKNVQNMCSKMTAEDRELFYFDVRRIVWSKMSMALIKGGRKYLVKDTEDTIPAGKRKYLLLKWLHYSLLTVLLFLFYKFLSFIFYSVYRIVV